MASMQKKKKKMAKKKDINGDFFPTPSYIHYSSHHIQRRKKERQCDFNDPLITKWKSTTLKSTTLF